MKEEQQPLPLWKRIGIGLFFPFCAALALLYARYGTHGNLCLFHNLTGLYCPGCGTGRAVSGFLRGRSLRWVMSCNALLLPLGIPALFVGTHEYLRVVFPACVAYLTAIGAALLFGFFSLPFAGIVLAARTEAARLHVLDATRFVATPPLVAVRVESPVRLCRMKRQEGWSADFLSHLGPLPIKAVIVLKEGAAPPAVGETWLCSGRLACKQKTENGLGRLDVQRARRLIGKNDVTGLQDAARDRHTLHLSAG